MIWIIEHLVLSIQGRAKNPIIASRIKLEEEKM